MFVFFRTEGVFHYIRLLYYGTVGVGFRGTTKGFQFSRVAS